MPILGYIVLIIISKLIIPSKARSYIGQKKYSPYILNDKKKECGYIVM